MYVGFFKRLIDVVLSFIGILVLSPIYLILALAVKLDSKGPVFFKQKRIGAGKNEFYILKFRTMRTDTPSDMPTHLLSNPDQWITKTGRFMRKTSLDELPQIFQIFTGKMSIIGPRPALWNQFDLIAERDKYVNKLGMSVNDLRPGLTGWAQVNGRDELEIAEKARLDGEYAEKISFLFDCKCFFGTVISVLKSDGVVEGGTGELARAKEEKEVVNK
ncbi:MAG: sugar transferase [Clostridia bacterium]|nr:sugar transferase [Clostridia bacterium]